MMSFLSRNIFVTLLLAAIIVGGMWYIFSGGDSEEELLTTTSMEGPESETEKEIIDTLLALEAVSLSGTIFSDPVFAILRDFGTGIIPEPTGRVNPFAPRGELGPARPAGASTQNSGSQR